MSPRQVINEWNLSHHRPSFQNSLAIIIQPETTIEWYFIFVFMHDIFFSIPDFSSLSSGDFSKFSGTPDLHFKSVVCLSTWWLFFQLSACKNGCQVLHSGLPLLLSFWWCHSGLIIPDENFVGINSNNYAHTSSKNCYFPQHKFSSLNSTDSKGSYEEKKVFFFLSKR